MKITALCLAALVSAASAFAPASQPVSTTGLRMSETPMLEKKETVPCFGAAPFIGTEVFFGENYWDKFTTEYGSAETGTFLRKSLLGGRMRVSCIYATSFTHLLF
jgi:hypothetical protein